MLEHFPEELKAIPQWVCADADRKPINPRTKRAASPTDPNTWATFAEACAAGYPHVGFVLSERDPYTIIDLDDKVDNPATEQDWNRHRKILDTMYSYTELSTSKRGYHIIVKGTIPHGVHRDKVEAYSTGRYMICTGDVVLDVPIAERQSILNMLFEEMAPPAIELVDVEGSMSDRDLVEMACNAVNGAKFIALGNGNIADYPSQSEADFALLSIIAYYTRDNEQVRRIFRYSALGKRDKAIRNDTYLDIALQKIRAQQPAPIDFTQLVANAIEKMPSPIEAPHIEVSEVTPTSANRGNSRNLDIPLPGGLIGELAQYFFATAIRPVPEVALCGAIALVAGVTARCFNVSGSGLNQYLILLARTGAGKEGALMGIENLISETRKRVPMVDTFIGPSAFASGQAIIKVLDERPCFVSVLGEFGLTLQQVCDPRASSAEKMTRKVLLDLFSKSGWNRLLRSSVYADTEKNTKIVQAPNVSILGESTPETFFEGLDVGHIAEGLIPRFSVIEYEGGRPLRNRRANVPPPTEVLERFIQLVTLSLTMASNNVASHVETDAEALLLLDDFDAKADAYINAASSDVDRQLWNRAHLKALKLAALVAVGCNPHKAVIDASAAHWAIEFVKRDVETMAKRFRRGDIGTGNSKQRSDLKRVIQAYFELGDDALAKYGVPKKMKADRVIPHVYLSRRTVNLASFKNDQRGASNALRGSLQDLVDGAELTLIPDQQLFDRYQQRGKAYGIGTTWVNE